jgi:excisionase family DNA binding protein
MEAVLETTTREDQNIAKSSVARLIAASQALKHAGTYVEIKVKGENAFLRIPTKALSLLVIILGNMAEGKSITLIPSDAVLSTQQAADFLNVSRPHLVKLLEEGQITFKKAGTHRRIELNDLIEYKKKQTLNKKEQLDFLAKQAQDLNLGY